MRIVPSLVPSIACGGIIGFLVEREKCHGCDAYWWTTLAILDSILIVTLVLYVIYVRRRLSIQSLLTVQFAFVCQALGARWFGSHGVALVFIAAMIAWGHFASRARC